MAIIKSRQQHSLPFDPSNRYRAASSRVFGTRDGARSMYPEVSGVSRARFVTPQSKAPSRRDRHRAEVASRRATGAARINFKKPAFAR
jgi:hypothetical protein